MAHRSNSEDRPVVIVTGSSGLLGTPLLERLKNRYQVVGFDRDGQPQPPREIECVCVDLADDRSVRLGVARTVFAYGTHLAAVVHLGAYYDFSGEPSDLYEQVNVRGTARLLDALREEGCVVEVFVYSSTMLVHAATEPGRPLDETAMLQPQWDYPRSKLGAEREIQARCSDGDRALLLRIAGVYTDRGDSIPLSQQLHRIAQRQLESHLYPGDVDRGQAFVHRDDVLDALEAAVDRRAELPPGATPLLIGEPETPSYGTLQRRLGELLHGDADWSTHHVPKALAKAGAWLKDKLPGEQFVKPWMIERADDHYELDIARARDVLGWTPRHRLLDTLPAIVASFRADPDAWRRHHGLE